MIGAVLEVVVAYRSVIEGIWEGRVRFEERGTEMQTEVQMKCKAESVERRVKIMVNVRKCSDSEGKHVNAVDERPLDVSQWVR